MSGKKSNESKDLLISVIKSYQGIDQDSYIFKAFHVLDLENLVDRLPSLQLEWQEADFFNEKKIYIYSMTAYLELLNMWKNLSKHNTWGRKQSNIVPIMKHGGGSMRASYGQGKGDWQHLRDGCCQIETSLKKPSSRV